MEEQSQKFAFDTILEKSFDLYKKIAIPAGIAIMTITVALLSIALVAFNYFVKDPKIFSEKMKNFDPNTLQEGTLIYFGIAITVSSLVAPFMAGVLKMIQEADTNQDVRYSSFFYYINHEKYFQIVLASLTIGILGVVTDLSLKQLLPENVGSALGFLLSTLLSIMTFLATCFILFSDMNFIEAIRASIQKTKEHFFSILLLEFIAVLFYIIGIFGLCIGIFFTLPFVYTVKYSIYSKVK